MLPSISNIEEYKSWNLDEDEDTFCGSFDFFLHLVILLSLSLTMIGLMRKQMTSDQR